MFPAALRRPPVRLSVVASLSALKLTHAGDETAIHPPMLQSSCAQQSVPDRSSLQQCKRPTACTAPPSDPANETRTPFGVGASTRAVVTVRPAVVQWNSRSKGIGIR